MNKPLEELYNLLKIRDYTPYNPDKDRKQALDQWINKWLVELEEEVSVVDTKYLTSDYSDDIKYRLAQTLSEQLVEDCAQIKVEERKIKAKVVGIRRIPPKK